MKRQVEVGDLFQMDLLSNKVQRVPTVARGVYGVPLWQEPMRPASPRLATLFPGDVFMYLGDVPVTGSTVSSTWCKILFGDVVGLVDPEIFRGSRRICQG